MKAKTYSDNLKDPRWQKLRLKIMERDEFKCRQCLDDKEQLQIHHIKYIANKLPWEYPEELLETLCVDCHKSITETNESIKNSLFEIIDFMSLEVLQDLLIEFKQMNISRQIDILQISKVLRDPF